MEFEKECMRHSRDHKMISIELMLKKLIVHDLEWPSGLAQTLKVQWRSKMDGMGHLNDCKMRSIKVHLMIIVRR